MRPRSRALRWRRYKTWQFVGAASHAAQKKRPEMAPYKTWQFVGAASHAARKKRPEMAPLQKRGKIVSPDSVSE